MIKVVWWVVWWVVLWVVLRVVMWEMIKAEKKVVMMVELWAES